MGDGRQEFGLQFRSALLIIGAFFQFAGQGDDAAIGLFQFQVELGQADLLALDLSNNRDLMDTVALTPSPRTPRAVAEAGPPLVERLQTALRRIPESITQLEAALQAGIYN